MISARYLEKLANAVTSSCEEKSKFIAAFNAIDDQPQGVIWTAPRPQESPFEIDKNPPEWLPSFVDFLAPGQRPGKHQLHETGNFYVLDRSSIFEASVLALVDLDSESKICDLCAAPGGKTIFASQLLDYGELICNEVAGKRVAALISNLKRCRIANAQVTSHDPKYLADVVPELFDLVLVDAPCSGQSLYLKGQGEAGAFHPLNISRNAKRQRRILNCAAALVKPGGYLAYMTCTFSPQENEENLDYLLERYPEFSALEVCHLAAYRSQLTQNYCYRLLPGSRLGAGGFTAVCKRAGDRQPNRGESVVGKLKVQWQDLTRD